LAENVTLAGPQLLLKVLPVTVCEKLIVPLADLAVRNLPLIETVVTVVCPATE
jgi:hypothetical protein